MHALTLRLRNSLRMCNGCHLIVNLKIQMLVSQELLTIALSLLSLKRRKPDRFLCVGFKFLPIWFLANNNYKRVEPSALTYANRVGGSPDPNPNPKP